MNNLIIPLLCALCCAFASAAGAVEPLPILGIAHVAFQSSNPEASGKFYTGLLGYKAAFVQTNPAAMCFKINDDQFVKLMATDGPTADDRLVEIALQVSDVSGTHALLRERGLKPTPVESRSDGTRATTLRDPDGHLIAFVQYTPDSRQALARGRFLGAQRVSTRLWHTGVTVADEARARAFYEEALGFGQIWRGGPEGQPTAWVHVQLPGARGDYLEYMLHREPLTRTRLGSMHHICLQVPDIQVGHNALLAAGLPPSETRRPQIGRIRRWLFNVNDPDGTRIELMEPDTVAEAPAAAPTTPSK